MLLIHFGSFIDRHRIQLLGDMDGRRALERLIFQLMRQSIRNISFAMMVLLVVYGSFGLALLLYSLVTWRKTVGSLHKAWPKGVF